MFGGGRRGGGGGGGGGAGGGQGAGLQRKECGDGEERRQIPPSRPVGERGMQGWDGGRRQGSGVRAGRRVQPLDVFVGTRTVCVRIGAVRVHVSAVLDLAVQAQTVPPLGAVGAAVAGERPLPGVHAHVLHQLVGCPRQVAAPVAPVLVALAMTLEVNQQLLLPWKRPLADAAAMLGGAILRLGCHGN